jgi:hypothetical protein
LQTSRENVRDAIFRKGLCKKFYLSYEKLDKFIVLKREKSNPNIPIYQYSLSGDFIKEFKNCEEASIELGLSKKSLQSKVAINKSYKGFQWSYNKVEKLDNITDKSKSSMPKKIEQYTLDGKLVTI